MEFLIQIGLAAIGFYVLLCIAALTLAGLFLFPVLLKRIWRFLSFTGRPVSNKVAYVAAAVLIAIAATPIVMAVVQR